MGSDGRQVARLSGGPVTSAVAIFEAEENGSGDAFFGMEDGFVRCIRGGKVVWKANVGGAPAAIMPLDVDGDGKPEVVCGSESAGVYALDRTGKRLWRTPLSDSVTGLAIVGNRIVAGCEDGRVYKLDAGGRIIAAMNAGAPVRAVAGSRAGGGRDRGRNDHPGRSPGFLSTDRLRRRLAAADSKQYHGVMNGSPAKTVHSAWVRRRPNQEAIHT